METGPKHKAVLMEVRSVPLGSVPVGPRSWSEATVQSIRRAQNLVRETRTESRSRSAGFTPRGSAGPARDQVQEEGAGRPEPTRTIRSRTRTAGGERTEGLREQCAAESATAVGDYMRRVREAELQLRRQAGNVAQEGVRQQKGRAQLERTLRSIRTDLSINRRSSENRSRRPAAAETDRDVVDRLLLWERRELTELNRDLEGALKASLSRLQVLGESSRQLLNWANERARVLDLVPRGGSAGSNGTTTRTVVKTDPSSCFTPECKQVLESSLSAVRESQLQRENIRNLLSRTARRQNSAHRTVNDGLIKKIAETISLQQRLAVASAASRQAAFRKQRQTNRIRYSLDRAQGPECRGDVSSGDKLDRPLVQVYQRHLGTQLPEAAHIRQGGAAIRRRLESSEGDLLRLQSSCRQLMDDLRRKTAAAQVDEAVVRMRRQQVDRKGRGQL